MLLLTSCNLPSLMEIHLSSPQAYKMQPVSKNFSKSDKVRPTLPCSLQARQDEDSVSKLSDCDKQPKIFLQTFWHSPEGSRAKPEASQQGSKAQTCQEQRQVETFVEKRWKEWQRRPLSL